MNKCSWIVLAVLVVSLSACGALPSSPSTPMPEPTVAAKTGKLRIASPSSPGLGDIPFWIAVDTLRQQGYEVETTQYARYDLVTAALVSGELDIAQSSHQTAWSAIAKGAPIRAVVGRLGFAPVLVAKPEIKTCADLQGKSVTNAGSATVFGALFDAYLRRNCPGTQPEIAVIPSSTNRLPALLSGVVVAGLLEEGDVLQLERQAPGKFHVLRYFAEEFPQVDSSAYYAHNDFAAEHADIVKDFVLALVQANRRVQDPQVLRDAIPRYLPDNPDAVADVDTYLAHKAWDVNGGLTLERVQYTLTFLTDAKVLPSGLRVEQVADLSYLNTVLAEIGRQ